MYQRPEEYRLETVGLYDCSHSGRLALLPFVTFSLIELFEFHIYLKKGVRVVDVSVITQVISSLGFPIFACVAMGYYIYLQQKNHKEEISELKKSIDNNTEMLNQILGFIQSMETKRSEEV